MIEAALIAAKLAPGFLRTHWGFMYHPFFESQQWLKVKIEADALRKELPSGHFFGVDANKSAVMACKANLAAAGLQNSVEIMHANIANYTPKVQAQLVFTNPPHGKRLDDVATLRPLYRTLGDFMKTKTAKPSKGFIFTGSLELAKEVGLTAKRRHVINNSGVDSRLLEYDIF